MLRSNDLGSVAPRGGRGLAQLLLSVVTALVCSGCLTAKVARIATAHDTFGQVGTAWAREDGGLVIVTDAALGTFSMSPVVVDVSPEALEAAHQADGPYALDRSTLKARDAVSMDGLDRLVVRRVDPGFDWTAEEVAELRPPGNSTRAVFCGGRHSDFRIAHVRAAGVYSGSGVTVAVLEMQPAEEVGPWWSWPLVPVALAAEVTVYAAAAVAVVVVGVVAVAFAGGNSRWGNS